MGRRPKTKITPFREQSEDVARQTPNNEPVVKSGELVKAEAEMEATDKAILEEMNNSHTTKTVVETVDVKTDTASVVPQVNPIVEKVDTHNPVTQTNDTQQEIVRLRNEIMRMRTDHLVETGKIKDELFEAKRVLNETMAENDNLMLRNSELEFENIRLEVENNSLESKNTELEEAVAKNIDTKSRKVYTMKTPNPQPKKRTRNHKYISSNGYQSWN